MRILYFHLAIQFAVYLLFSFVTFDLFWIVGDIWIRSGYLFASFCIQLLTIPAVYIGELPDFLKTPTHEEKKSSIKKYIGELHEELSLYGEAMELQRKIKEFKSKQ